MKKRKITKSIDRFFIILLIGLILTVGILSILAEDITTTVTVVPKPTPTPYHPEEPEKAVCGNGITETGEGCDDGNILSGDGCSNSCSTEIYVCGNGITETEEQCDDGNTVSGDGCSNICRVEVEFCGDNIIGTGEECDDGNFVNGDGCSDVCQIEEEEIVIKEEIEEKEEEKIEEEKKIIKEEEEEEKEEEKIEEKEEGEEEIGLLGSLLSILSGILNLIINISIALINLIVDSLKNFAQNALDLRRDPVVKNFAAKTLAPLAIIGVIVISYIGAIAIVGSLSNLAPLLAQLWGAILQFFGIKKKKKSWGIVYNSSTKEPADLAIVRLIDAKTNKILQTVVTNKEGKFTLDPVKERFYINITKTSYIFPSKLVRGLKVDGRYDNLYFGENIKSSEKQRVDFSIPIDPLYVMRARRGYLDRLKSLLNALSTPVLIFGIIFSLILLWINTNLINTIILLMYIFLFLLKTLLLRSPTKPWGRVFDIKTKKPVQGVVVRLFDQKYDKLLETKITDKKGSFNFLLPEGKYYLRMLSNQYGFANKKKVKVKYGYYGDPFEIQAKKQMRINIPLAKKRTMLLSEGIKISKKAFPKILKYDTIFDYLEATGKSLSQLSKKLK